jgi:hypothetical protein
LEDLSSNPNVSFTTLLYEPVEPVEPTGVGDDDDETYRSGN